VKTSTAIIIIGAILIAITLYCWFSKAKKAVAARGGLVMGGSGAAVAQDIDLRGNVTVPYGNGFAKNNPGNLQSAGWKGEVPNSGRFPQFTTLGYGWRALLKNLAKSYRNVGATTIRQIISRWAPPSENNTEAYISFVASRAGISPDAPIAADDRDTYTKIASAIAIQESGQQYAQWAAPEYVNLGWELLQKYPN